MNRSNIPENFVLSNIICKRVYFSNLLARWAAISSNKPKSFHSDSHYRRHTKPGFAQLNFQQNLRQLLLLTSFIRLCLENGTLKWRSVAINGHHTHVVLSVRIKPCYLSGCNIWRKKFPDRDVVVTAVCNHNKEAHATI